MVKFVVLVVLALVSGLILNTTTGSRVIGADWGRVDCVKPVERVLPSHIILQDGKKYLPASVRDNIIWNQELLYCRILPWFGAKSYRFVLLYKTNDAGYIPVQVRGV